MRLDSILSMWSIHWSHLTCTHATRSNVSDFTEISWYGVSPIVSPHVPCSRSPHWAPSSSSVRRWFMPLIRRPYATYTIYIVWIAGLDAEVCITMADNKVSKEYRVPNYWLIQKLPFQRLVKTVVCYLDVSNAISLLSSRQLYLHYKKPASSSWHAYSKLSTTLQSTQTVRPSVHHAQGRLPVCGIGIAYVSNFGVFAKK